MKLTLADLDAEAPESQEPFVIDLGDEEVVLPSAMQIPASLLAGLGNATEMDIAAKIIGGEGWQRILGHPSMNLARLQVLSGKYNEYLQASGLGELGKSRPLPR